MLLHPLLNTHHFKIFTKIAEFVSQPVKKKVQIISHFSVLLRSKGCNGTIIREKNCKKLVFNYLQLITFLGSNSIFVW